MKKITATQRVITIFSTEPLEKVAILLELAQGIVDLRQGAEGGVSGTPSKRRGRKPAVVVPATDDKVGA